MKIYERVREYIISCGIKQSAISKKTGISQGTLSAIMCGKRKMYAEDLEAICNALEVNAGMFFTDQSA